MTRDALKEAIANDEVTEDAVYRDRWSHPRWYKVFDHHSFRKLVPADSPLALKWEQERRAKAENASKALAEMWPQRFEGPFVSRLGLSNWHELGRNCAGATRLIRFPALCTAEALTCRWHRDSVEVELSTIAESRTATLKTSDLMAPLNAGISDLEATFCALVPVDNTLVLDGVSYVHRFANQRLEISVMWSNPRSPDHPEHVAVLAAYHELARGLGGESWTLSCNPSAKKTDEDPKPGKLPLGAFISKVRALWRKQ